MTEHADEVSTAAANQPPGDRLLLQLRKLACRAYPGLKATGACSAHQYPSADDHACDRCYPDYRARCAKLQEENRQLLEALKSLRDFVLNMRDVPVQLEPVSDDTPITKELTMRANPKPHVERTTATMAEASHTWRPIATAPMDGTYVLLAGDSGYVGTPLRVEVCRYDAVYRPLAPWVNHALDAFLDGGAEPLFWLPLPTLPKEFG